MGAIKREMNHAGWFWFAVGWQTGLAYVVSMCIYQIGTLIATGTFGVGTAVSFVCAAGFLWLLFRPHREREARSVRMKGMAAR